jgi:hypothetical protein
VEIKVFQIEDGKYHGCYKHLKILPIFQAYIKVFQIEDGKIS